MEEKEFVGLVDELEVYARENPGTYRLRVGFLAALGYLFLFGILATLLLIIFAFIYFGKLNYLVIKLSIIPLGLALFVLRSLWIKFPRPEGVELKYADAPRLFDLVKEIRKATNGPKVHKVLLTDEYNAGIIQRPRLGVFGWQENYLLVGLPLMRALSPTDVRAIMCHEFGHLSGNHGRFGGWVYRVRQTWNYIMQNLQQRPRHGSFIFERFFDWYSPYFAAYSFVLARSREYEADRCAVDVVGREHAARALINLELKQKVISEEYWPAVHKRADKEPEPPANAFSELLQSLHAPVAPEMAQLWFAQSLAKHHVYSDTHPELAERLEAIGYPDVRRDAALESFEPNGDECGSDQYFLANTPEDFIEGINRWCRERLETHWTERHAFVKEAEQGLVALAEKAKTTELTLEERWDRARFTAGTQGNVAAIPLLKDVLVLRPDHVASNYTLGEALLEQGDEAGINHIEAAMEKDFEAIPTGCELIYIFLNARERFELAETYRRRAADHYDKLELARRERENISTHDDFQPHGLTGEAIEEMRAQLANFPRLKSARFVRKVVKHFPESPSYVLGIISKAGWFGLQSNQSDQKLIDELAKNVTFPGYTYIIALEHNYKGLRRIFKRIDGALIYQS